MQWLVAAADDGWHGGWPWLFPLWILFWVVLAWAIFRLVGRGGRFRRPTSPDDQARSILAERYARGEIDAAEYRSRLDGLAH
jgi:putative membrane protein